jgi:hypothetical protein
MCLRTDQDRLSGSYSRKQPTPHGPSETVRRCRLATPKNSYQHTKILRIHRILLLLHPKLFENSETSPRSNEESYSLEVGATTNASI